MHVTGIREAGCLLSSSPNDYPVCLVSKRTTARMTILVPHLHSSWARFKRSDVHDKQQVVSDVWKPPLRQKLDDVIIMALDSGFVE